LLNLHSVIILLLVYAVILNALFAHSFYVVILNAVSAHLFDVVILNAVKDPCILFGYPDRHTKPDLLPATLSRKRSDNPVESSRTNP
jgi:hypothetical protein